MIDQDLDLPGVVEAPDVRRAVAEGNTFVLTAAQSNTKLHEGFWKSLQHFCKDRNAELHVSRFMYNKTSFHMVDEKPDADEPAQHEAWFDPRIEPFVSDESLELCPTLVWCGELNIRPTTVNPISGFQNYTRSLSSIIPHAKQHMESVPTMRDEPIKQVFTTGAVTQRNYIQKAAGQKAEFHHIFGAIIVEVDEDGTWWARQLNASNDGSFYDLTDKYTPQGVRRNKRLQAITHGDIHFDKADHNILWSVFETGGILDLLKPREQFFHDLIDFMPRNHHNIKDPLHWHAMHRIYRDSVQEEFTGAARFLSGLSHRKWCDSYVVVSNHDQAVNQWLRNTSALLDPPNIEFWHELNLMALQSNDPHPFEQALRRELQKISPKADRSVRVLRESDSYRILGEIEAALHGHIGPSGSRGSPKGLRGIGKANTGHTHASGVFEGIFTAGVYGKLDMGYNVGPSAWSAAFIGTYANAKRAIYTIKKGRAWR